MRIYIFLFIFLLSCNKKTEVRTATHSKEIASNLLKALPAKVVGTSVENVIDTGFVVMNRYAEGFVYDMKYATDDNFLKKAVYSCNNCVIRKEVADALIGARDILKAQGLKIKFYDCYRPLDVQKKMWEIFPDARYVANPNSATGSIHNRGGAVDITLVNVTGDELDMGTGFDHFDKEAHHAYLDLPDTVLKNRRLLKETMEKAGFNAIKTEWWHYNFKGSANYTLSNFKVECN